MGKDRILFPTTVFEFARWFPDDIECSSCGHRISVTAGTSPAPHQNASYDVV